MKNSEWEVITDEKYETTDRLKVDGGYLYRSIRINDECDTIAMSFVPEIDLTRYQSHLRDAYNKGFADGVEAGKYGAKGVFDV